MLKNAELIRLIADLVRDVPHWEASIVFNDAISGRLFDSPVLRIETKYEFAQIGLYDDGWDYV